MLLTFFWTYIVLLAAHWVADFVLQTNWQATNKSKNCKALSGHVLSYTGVLLLVSFFVLGFDTNAGMFVIRPILWAFVLLNGVLHFCTDYVTSRITSKLYVKQDWHNFFVVIGFDQLIHQTTLAVTLWWFFGQGN